jgi:predicted Zn-dependent protease
MTRTMRVGRSLTALLAIVTATTVTVAPHVWAAPAAGQAEPSSGQTTSVVAPAEAGSVAADFSSIFTGPNASLAGAGWKSCAAPVQWTVDTHELSAREAAAQVRNLAWALNQWSKVSGLTFQYAGRQAVTYDDAAFTIAPADGSPVQSRHVYFDFVRPSESARLGGGTVGLGSPSQVMPTTKEIVSGAAVFRTDHVKGATTSELRSLYLHEIGHVLGLAHAQVVANVMYPTVTDHTQLGAGDINGVRRMTKACTS